MADPQAPNTNVPAGLSDIPAGLSDIPAGKPAGQPAGNAPAQAAPAQAAPAQAAQPQGGVPAGLSDIPAGLSDIKPAGDPTHNSDPAKPQDKPSIFSRGFQTTKGMYDMAADELKFQFNPEAQIADNPLTLLHGAMDAAKKGDWKGASYNALRILKLVPDKNDPLFKAAQQIMNNTIDESTAAWKQGVQEDDAQKAAADKANSEYRKGEIIQGISTALGSAAHAHIVGAAPFVGPMIQQLGGNLDRDIHEKNWGAVAGDIIDPIMSWYVTKGIGKLAGAGRAAAAEPEYAYHLRDVPEAPTAGVVKPPPGIKASSIGTKSLEEVKLKAAAMKTPTQIVKVDLGKMPKGSYMETPQGIKFANDIGEGQLEHVSPEIASTTQQLSEQGAPVQEAGNRIQAEQEAQRSDIGKRLGVAKKIANESLDQGKLEDGKLPLRDTDVAAVKAKELLRQVPSEKFQHFFKEWADPTETVEGLDPNEGATTKPRALSPEEFEERTTDLSNNIKAEQSAFKSGRANGRDLGMLKQLSAAVNENRWNLMEEFGTKEAAEQVRTISSEYAAHMKDVQFGPAKEFFKNVKPSQLVGKIITAGEGGTDAVQSLMKHSSAEEIGRAHV